VGCCLLDDPLHHTGADAKFPADLEDAVAVGLQFENSRFHSGLNATPAELGPIRPRPRQTGVDPFSNDPALKLSKYTQHLKHRLAGGRRTINRSMSVVRGEADSQCTAGHFRV
jgi:hypothetical protein